MRQKLLLFTLLLVIVGYLVTTIGTHPDGSFSIGNWYPLSGGAPSESQASPLRATATLPAAFSSEERHKVLYDPYRLKIDSRFLLAVEEVSHLVTGQSVEPVKAAFRTGTWVIRFGDSEIGTVPEYPDFSDFLPLLVDWARVAARTHPIESTSAQGRSVESGVQRRLNEFLAEDSAAALRLLDERWQAGVHHVEIVEAAAKGLVNLSLQQLDKIEVSDRLPAKALAALAVARSLDPKILRPEETLLAYSMGYSTHARHQAALLSDNDPIRLFVFHQDQALRGQASSPSASRQSHYLWLLRQQGCGCGDLKTYFEWINKYFPRDVYRLPIVKTALDLNDFSLGPQLSETLPSLVLLTLAREIDMPGLPDALKKFDRGSYSDKELRTIVTAIALMLTTERDVLLDRFESGLNLLDKEYRGPFLDANTYKGYYAGYFFSALHTLGIHYLDKLSSGRAVENFVTSLGSPNRGVANEFSLWYRHLADLYQGKGDATVLANDIQTLTLLGAPPFIRSYTEIKNRRWAAGSADSQLVRSMMVHLDSRPQHRYELGQMAYSDLLDLNLTDKLYSTVTATDPAHFEDFTAWYLNFAGESERLIAMLDNASVGDHAKLMALRKLAHSHSAAPEFIESHYADLMRRNPGDWTVAADYIKFLEDVKQYGKGRAVASRWLNQKVTNGSLAPVLATADIAWMYYLEGRYPEAWETIRTVIDSWQGTALYRASLILEKLNRPDEAERMGRAMLDRYPRGAKGRGMVAYLYWKHAKPDQAAEVLKTSPTAITLYEWEHEIGPFFEEAFEGQSIESATRAVALLQQAGMNEFSLYRLSFVPAQHGKHELAYALLSELRSNPSFFLYAYAHHKEWEGKEKALKTLHQYIPVGQFGPASNVMYDDGQYDLLWDFSDQIDPHALGDYIWLLRAASLNEAGTYSEDRQRSLMNYYSQHSSGHYNMLGRFLMGLSSEAELIGEGGPLASTAYYLGLKAKHEGRYVDASDWFRFGMEKGSSQEPEHKWCGDALRRWRLAEHNLDYAAAKKL
jgi:hypothetical protein